MAVTRDRKIARGLLAAACLAALGLAGDAWAQQGYGPASAYGASGSTTPEAAMRALHEALHLSAQQEPAWQAYRARALQASQAQGRQQAAARLLPTLDAPHRMDLVEAEMRAELAEQHNQAQLVKALYAQLSPNQRAIFDQRTLPRQSGQ